MLNQYGSLPGNPHGSSGATLEFLPDGTVWKAGNKRVGQQGKWLVEHQSLATPYVHYVADDCYSMERLSELPRKLIHGNILVTEMFRVLRDDVWAQDAEVEFDHLAFFKKIDLLIYDHCPELRAGFFTAFDHVDWPKQTACLTHGDPTVDNVMLRDGLPVIIDPIPATPAVPDLRCVDIGKMLQSAVGYEEIRFGATWLTGFNVSVIFSQIPPVERQASMYWCAVHLLRAMPYVPGDVREQFPKIITRCLDLVRSGRRDY